MPSDLCVRAIRAALRRRYALGAYEAAAGPLLARLRRGLGVRRG